MPFDPLHRLQTGVLLGDGGSLFELERRGYVQAGPYTPEVAVEHPEALAQLHREFVRAGAEVLQALTFYGTADKLGRSDAEVNRAAIRVARGVAGSEVAVAGGLSPTPTFRTGDRSRVLPLMQRHLEAQGEEGVDLLCAETFVFLEEALLAVRAMRGTGLPCVLTMNIGPGGSRDGFTPEECARRLEGAGADAVGVNCSFDPDVSLEVASRMARVVRCPVACQPIAYRSPDEGTPFEEWPEFPLEVETRQMGRGALARFALRAREAGIRLIGGCCGVAPHHLRAMAEALGRRPEASEKSPDMARHMIPEVRSRFQEQSSGP